MFVLIPAFEPGARMPALVAELLSADPDLDVLIVDDGSGSAFASVFAAAREAGAHVITHPSNQGKGAALKTGFAHIVVHDPDADVVTADADGQHTPADVCRVADALRRDAADGRSALVLGVRGFRGAVPLRSRVGNAAARGLFRLATGRQVTDTQTGLRGIPSDRLDWALGIPGEGFEYEQRMLLRLGPDQLAAHEVPIDTVYLDRNASSHFRPVRDSLRVLLPVLLFASSSLAAFVVDTVALLVLQALTGWLVPSIIAARVLSATANFVVNRRVVFRARGGPMLGQAVRYGVLALALLASNIAWMSFLTDNGLALLPAKVVTEGVLFVLSYGVQRSLVFPRTDAGPPARRPISRPDPPFTQVPEPVEGTGTHGTPGGFDRLSPLPPRHPDPRKEHLMTTTALILAATDLVAAVLLSAIYFQRHRRRDLVVAFLGVNVGVLAVATVLGTAEVALGLGLGLFGVLSIIRLRSSEITQREVAYYFAALAIGLICGLPPVDLSIPLLLVGLIVAVLAVADHPRVLSQARHQTVHLDRAIADETELRAELERLLGGEVTGVTVQQLDLVDDTTLVDVRYRVSAARPVTAAPGGVRDTADVAPGPRRSADPTFADLIGGTR